MHSQKVAVCTTHMQSLRQLVHRHRPFVNKKVEKAEIMITGLIAKPNRSIRYYCILLG